MLIAAAGLAGALVGTRTLWAGGVEYRVVASSAMPPPGVSAGAGFQVGAPTIDQAGQVAFGLWSGQTRSIVIGSPGSVQQVLRNGQPFPGDSGNFIGQSLFPPLITGPSSVIAYGGAVSGNLMVNATLSGASVIVRQGQPLPGVENIQLAAQPLTTLGLVAQPGFTALTTGVATASTPQSGAGVGMWRTDGGTTRLVAHTSIPATNTGTAFFAPQSYPEGYRLPGSMVMNRAGTLAFDAPLTTANGSEGELRSGIWIDTPSSGLQPVVLAGTSAENTLSSVIPGISLNQAGDIAFQAVSRTSGRGVFVRDHSGTIRPVFSSTNVLGANGRPFVSIGPPILNDHGQVLAGFESHDNYYPSGLVITDGTSQQIVWQDGVSSLAGNPNALTLSFYTLGLPSTRVFGTPDLQRVASFNNASQAVFILDSLAPGAPSTSIRTASVLAGWDPIGGLIELARIGGAVPLAGFEGQTITSLNWVGGSNGYDGRVSSLNDNGDVVFSVQTSAGQTAVILAHLPTPSAAVPLCILGLLASRRRR